MFNQVIEVKCISISDVLAPLTEDRREDFYQYLGEADVCWGTNSYSLINKEYILEMLQEYLREFGEDEMFEKVREIGNLAPFIDLES